MSTRAIILLLVMIVLFIFSIGILVTLTLIGESNEYKMASIKHSEDLKHYNFVARVARGDSAIMKKRIEKVISNNNFKQDIEDIYEITNAKPEVIYLLSELDSNRFELSNNYKNWPQNVNIKNNIEYNGSNNIVILKVYEIGSYPILSISAYIIAIVSAVVLLGIWIYHAMIKEHNNGD